MIQIQQEQKIQYFYLFINSGSGGGLGKKLTSIEINKISFQMKDANDVQIHAQVKLINMRKPEEKDKGFLQTRQLSERGQKVIGVICGGDGSIMWVAQQFKNYKINPMKVPVAVIPLGTGNDFSRFLGWGGQQTKFTQKQFSELKRLVKDWRNAQEQQFDLWDMEATSFNNGYLQKVNNEGQNIKLQQKTYKKAFCNYFSFGIDGKIGYSFDKHRTNSRIGNYMMYCGLGVVKGMTKTKQLTQLVQRMSILKQKEPILQIKFKKNEKEGEQVIEKIKQSDKEIVFETEAERGIIRNGLGEEYKKTYYNLLALNIDSFMGGTKQIWKNASMGIHLNSENKFVDQSPSDGILQFVSFGSGVCMAVQKVISGWGEKVSQGSGPFLIEFHQYPHGIKHRTYLQIDGEFVRFTNPKTIFIRKSSLFPNGKIKVLRKTQR